MGRINVTTYEEHDEVLEEISGETEAEKVRECIEAYPRLKEQTGVTFDPINNQLGFDFEKTHRENYKAVLKFLFEKGHLTMENVPYATPRARKRWLLNTEPVHMDGEEMERPVEPIPGVFANSKHDQARKKANPKHLIDLFVTDK